MLSLAHLICQKTLLSDTDYHDRRDSFCLLAIRKWITLLTPHRFTQSLQVITQVSLLQLIWNCSFNLYHFLLAKLNTHIPISEVGRLRHSHYIKLHKGLSRTLMLSPFKHVGGILNVFSRAFPLRYLSFFMAIQRQADEARRLNRGLKMMLLLHCCEAERRFQKCPWI